MNQMNDEAIEQTIRDYVLREFLPGEPPDQLTASTPLMTSGLVDSIRLLRFITFLEDTFGVRIEAHEADPDRMNTVALIAELVREKRA
jgi:acyl carrier protein